MFDDPVIHASVIVFIVVFFAVLIAIAVLYVLIRTGEKGEARTPHKGQIWLAALIGIAVPLLILAYAVLFSPSARMTPKQLHQQELEKLRK